MKTYEQIECDGARKFESRATLGLRRRYLLVVAGALTALLVAGSVLPVAALVEPPSLRKETFYSVTAHADDEYGSWSLIENHPERYTIFVTLTKGELTHSCLTREEADQWMAAKPEDQVGPYKYQGANPPFEGQPDKGERHPLGNPWQGWVTDDCKRARVASWHWFLDDMSKVDTGLPDFGISADPVGDPYKDDDYQGAFCLPDGDSTENGTERSRGKGTNVKLGCVDVWANEHGARVAYDLGDGRETAEPLSNRVTNPHPINPESVVAAIEALRANRARWGIKVLPENGAVAGYYSEPEDCRVNVVSGPYDHTDHGAVARALHEHDLDIGPQYGPVCDGHPWWLESGGPVFPFSPLGLVYANNTDFVNNRSTGPWQVNYGWLFADGEWVDLSHPGSSGRWTNPAIAFWKRFG